MKGLDLRRLSVDLLKEVHIGLADYARSAQGFVQAGRSGKGLGCLHVRPFADDDHVARIVGIAEHTCPQRTCLLAKGLVAVVYGSIPAEPASICENRDRRAAGMETLTRGCNTE